MEMSITIKQTSFYQQSFCRFCCCNPLNYENRLEQKRAVKYVLVFVNGFAVVETRLCNNKM
jgi:hypothetical protein